MQIFREKLDLEQLGKEWPHISRAREQARAQVDRAREILSDMDLPQHTAVVVFGSLARLEWTSGSDLDWTLLIDGPSDPEHFQVVLDIGEKLRDAGFKSPGRTATFGQMSSSHELIHHIGGQDDTNQNLTRRVLLLLESCCLTDAIPYERVLRGILKRYIVGDPSVSIGDSRPKVPRFLLNDIVRLWRTFAVDYAWKRWERSNEGWALRNAKLRLARKMTFVKGLLMCFDCKLNQGATDVPASATADIVANLLTGNTFELARMSPIDVLSRILGSRAAPGTIDTLLGAYDSFLGMIDDHEKRRHLEQNVDFATAMEDTVFGEVRQISHEFRDGVEALFFDDDDTLKHLTRRYGVF